MTERARRALLDPDVLAGLEEQRDFLLRSLDDLEAERAAGDLDEADHTALADDYTARAAAVLRQIEDRRAAVAATRTPKRRSRTLVLSAAVALVAVLAGVAVAQAAGRRDAGDNITGGIREAESPERAVRAELIECGGTLGEQEVLAAVECYDAVLQEDPENPEALAYRGWALVPTGDDRLVATGLDYLQQAVDADATYPDARVFRAITFSRQGRVDDALAELDVVYANDPPPAVTDLADPLREQLERQAASTG